MTLNLEDPDTFALVRAATRVSKAARAYRHALVNGDDSALKEARVVLDAAIRAEDDWMTEYEALHVLGFVRQSLSTAGGSEEG